MWDAILKDVEKNRAIKDPFQYMTLATSDFADESKASDNDDLQRMGKIATQIRLRTALIQSQISSLSKEVGSAAFSRVPASKETDDNEVEVEGDARGRSRANEGKRAAEELAFASKAELYSRLGGAEPPSSTDLLPKAFLTKGRSLFTAVHIVGSTRSTRKGVGESEDADVPMEDVIEGEGLEEEGCGDILEFRVDAADKEAAALVSPGVLVQFIKLVLPFTLPQQQQQIDAHSVDYDYEDGEHLNNPANARESSDEDDLMLDWGGADYDGGNHDLPYSPRGSVAQQPAPLPSRSRSLVPLPRSPVFREEDQMSIASPPPASHQQPEENSDDEAVVRQHTGVPPRKQQAATGRGVGRSPVVAGGRGRGKGQRKQQAKKDSDAPPLMLTGEAAREYLHELREGQKQRRKKKTSCISGTAQQLPDRPADAGLQVPLTSTQPVGSNPAARRLSQVLEDAAAGRTPGALDVLQLRRQVNADSYKDLLEVKRADLIEAAGVTPSPKARKNKAPAKVSVPSSQDVMTEDAAEDSPSWHHRLSVEKESRGRDEGGAMQQHDAAFSDSDSAVEMMDVGGQIEIEEHELGDYDYEGGGSRAYSRSPSPSRPQHHEYQQEEQTGNFQSQDLSMDVSDEPVEIVGTQRKVSPPDTHQSACDRHAAVIASVRSALNNSDRSGANNESGRQQVIRLDDPHFSSVAHTVAAVVFTVHIQNSRSSETSVQRALTAIGDEAPEAIEVAPVV